MSDTAQTEPGELRLPSTDGAGDDAAPGAPFVATTAAVPVAPAPPADDGVDDLLLAASLMLLMGLAAAVLALLRMRERLRQARLDLVRAGEDAEQARKLLGRAEEVTEAKVRHRTARLVERCQQLERERDELERVSAVLKGMVKNDGLTGLANAPYFERRLDGELRRAQRTGNVLSVLVCDVDRFNQFNRQAGHDRGDLLLRRLGRMLGRSFRRGGEVVARLGADRFAVLIPDADGEHAVSCARNFLDTVRDESLTAQGGGQPMTVSVGLVCLAPGETRRVHELLEEAIAALARAKGDGGNALQIAASDRVFTLRGDDPARGPGDDPADAPLGTERGHGQPVGG